MYRVALQKYRASSAQGDEFGDAAGPFGEREPRLCQSHRQSTESVVSAVCDGSWKEKRSLRSFVPLYEKSTHRNLKGSPSLLNLS